MATKKQKDWYYVLVMTDEGPKFVTGLGEHHTAYWDKDKKPYEVSKEWAEDMARGLLWNGHVAYVVKSQWELDTQPYNYKEWQIKWEQRVNEEEGSEE